LKVLLDEDLPHVIRHHLPMHEVFTVRYVGWSGLRNGKLLQAAEDDGYDVLLTGDQGMVDQQNMNNRHIAIVSLSAQEWRIIKPFLDRINAAIDLAMPGSVHTVECGEFRR
jgi:hypothetical protein